MSKSVIEVLKEAREKIRQGWCQGGPARDHRDATISTGDPNACKWCLFGALMAVTDDWDGPRAAIKEFTGCSLAEWNDAPGRTKAEVLALLDKAIERAEAEA